MNQYIISFERDGVFVPDGTYTYEQMSEQNSDCVEFMKRLDAMKPGDVIRDGGGAQSLIEIRCEVLFD